jgi:hypothetical protein
MFRLSSNIVSILRINNFVDRETRFLYKFAMEINKELEIAKTVYCYVTDIFKIAAYPIWEKITVRGIRLSRGTIQRAYIEMKKIEFRGDIIDYLCYCCLNYAVSSSIISFKDLTAKENVEMFRLFVNQRKKYLTVICRLILKDETYFDDVLKQYKLDSGKYYEQYYDGVKKIIFKSINELLKVEPKYFNKNS